MGEEDVKQLVDATFRRRRRHHYQLDNCGDMAITSKDEDRVLLGLYGKKLGGDGEAAWRACQMVREVIQMALYSSAEVESEDQVFDLIRPVLGSEEEGFGRVLARVVHKRLATWREVAIKQKPCLSRYLGCNVRVDMKTSADNVSTMAVPTVFVSIDMEKNVQRVDESPELEQVNFELSKESLNTLLQGLEHIKSQLDKLS